MTAITENELINYTLAINDYVKEFDKYSYASNLIFIFNSLENLEEEEMKALKNIVSHKICSTLELSNKDKNFNISSLIVK